MVSAESRSSKARVKWRGSWVQITAYQHMIAGMQADAATVSNLVAGVLPPTVPTGNVVDDDQDLKGDQVPLGAPARGRGLEAHNHPHVEGVGDPRQRVEVGAVPAALDPGNLRVARADELG